MSNTVDPNENTDMVGKRHPLAPDFACGIVSVENDQYMMCIRAREACAEHQPTTKARGPDTFELTKQQASHVFEVLRDANMGHCLECGPIQEEIERWLNR